MKEPVLVVGPLEMQRVRVAESLNLKSHEWRHIRRLEQLRGLNPSRKIYVARDQFGRPLNVGQLTKDAIEYRDIMRALDLFSNVDFVDI